MRIEALGPLEHALVHHALSAQHRHRLVDRAAALQLGLGRELVMVNVEEREIVANKVEHRLDRCLFEQLEPLGFGGGGEFVAILRGEQGSDGLKIVAGVETFRDLADVFAEFLAVSEVQRPGEGIDLRARIVEIIFLRYAETRRLEHPRKAVPDHGAAAMADVQRPGRVGRHIFDVHPLVLACLGEAVTLAFSQDCPKLITPRVRRQPKVDEAGPRHLDRDDRRKRFELGLDRLRKRARIGLGALGQNHRRVGRKIAVRGIARRLDRDSTALETLRQRPFGNKLVEHPVEKRGILGVQAQITFHRCWKAAPLAHDRAPAKARTGSRERPPRLRRA